jgi:hypothetical protein
MSLNQIQTISIQYFNLVKEKAFQFVSEKQEVIAIIALTILSTFSLSCFLYRINRKMPARILAGPDKVHKVVQPVLIPLQKAILPIGYSFKGIEEGGVLKEGQIKHGAEILKIKGEFKFENNLISGNGRLENWQEEAQVPTYVFEGKVKKGCPSNGILTWQDGDVYNGQFDTEKEILTGKGTITRKNGLVFKGIIEKGIPISGELIWANGDLWIGEVDTSFKPWGRGKLIDHKGTIYEGVLRDGLLVGEGKITYSDGSGAEGNFKDNLLNGKGTFKKADGTVLEGLFKDGVLSGLGKITYPNKSSLEGEFEGEKLVCKIVYDEQKEGTPLPTPRPLKGQGFDWGPLKPRNAKTVKGEVLHEEVSPRAEAQDDLILIKKPRARRLSF